MSRELQQKVQNANLEWRRKQNRWTIVDFGNTRLLHSFRQGVDDSLLKRHEDSERRGNLITGGLRDSAAKIHFISDHIRFLNYS